MSTLQVTVDTQLARTVQWTGRLHARAAGRRALARMTAAVDYLARGAYHVWRNRRYITVLKLANMALLDVQHRLKTEYVLGRPYNMKIESTNICNTHCQLCPTGTNQPGGRGKGKMSLEQFQKLIDQFRPFLYTVDLSMWGDPLIVPDIFRMVRYAHDRGIWTYISSNLHAFKPDKGQAEKLVESGLDVLTCSLHGASQETYEQYQPGKNFEATVEKIRQLIQTRDRMGSATPVVQLNFVVTRHNEHERERFAELARELGCRPIFSEPSLNVRFVEQEHAASQPLQQVRLGEDLVRKQVMARLDQWLPTDQRFVIEPYRMLREGKLGDAGQFNGTKLMDCSWPWKAAVINWDGSVSPCCGSWNPEEDMGNVLEQPFAHVWNGPKYRMARRSFKKKLTDSQAQGVSCASCPGFML